MIIEARMDSNMISRDSARLIYHAGTFDYNDALFHYTTTEVLNILFDSCTFRASNLFYLNDSEEYYAGIRQLKKYMKMHPQMCGTKTMNILNELSFENGRGDLDPGIYSISFSKEKDLLSQWITYAKESGVAIELDSKVISESGLRWYGVESFTKTDEVDATEFNSLLFFSLQYSLHEIDYAKTFKPMNTSGAILNRHDWEKEAFQFIASYYKDVGFEAEKEVRLSVFPMCCGTEKGNKEATICYYRMGERGILRPYLNVTIGYRKTVDGKYYFQPCLPIKTITVGPGKNQQEVFNSIIHRIRYGKPRIYNYAENTSLLNNSIYNYISEIMEWLYRKEYIDYNVREDESIRPAFESISQMITDNERMNKKDKQLVERLITNIIIGFENNYHITIDCYSKLSDNEAQLKPREENILRELKNDLFFSKEGIIVKKSILPYIF